MLKEEKTKKGAAKICPECGEDVSKVDIKVHRDGHWGRVPPDPRLYPDAAKRWDILTAMAEEQ